MLYRKQYKIGAIFTSIMVALSLLSTYITLYFSGPLRDTLMQQAGITADVVSPTYEQTIKLMELTLNLPIDQLLLICIPGLLGMIQLVVMIVSGFNGNKWYLKHCVEKVKAIQNSAQNATDTAIQLQEHGGVNTALAICLLICYMIFMYISQF